MDPPDHNKNPPIGFGGSGQELTHGSDQQIPPEMVVAPDGTIQPPTGQPGQNQPAQQVHRSRQQQARHHRWERQMNRLRQQLQSLWENQRREIEWVDDFKDPILPLARIKAIMKADEDARVIAAEAPVFFVKACEMLASELTLLAWNRAEWNNRRTLLKVDVAAALKGKKIFDFLLGVVPMEVEQLKGACASVPRQATAVKGNLVMDPGGTSMPVPGPWGSVPYCYMPLPHAPQVGTAEVMMSDPANIHAQHPHHCMAPRGGTTDVIMGDPAMKPNLCAQHPDPYMAPPQMQQHPPEEQQARQMWQRQQLDQLQALEMWLQQPPEQQQPPQDH